MSQFGSVLTTDHRYIVSWNADSIVVVAVILTDFAIRGSGILVGSNFYIIIFSFIEKMMIMWFLLESVPNEARTSVHHNT